MIYSLCAKCIRCKLKVSYRGSIFVFCLYTNLHMLRSSDSLISCQSERKKKNSAGSPCCFTSAKNCPFKVAYYFSAESFQGPILSGVIVVLISQDRASAMLLLPFLGS